jgi:hypothetical protein
MNNSADFLRECMQDPALVPSGPVPINDFTKVYCLRCSTKQCSRSAGSNFVFTNRVKNWKRDLFDAPPRAVETDAVFDAIRAKRFVQVSTQLERQPEAIQKTSSSPIEVIEETLETLEPITPPPKNLELKPETPQVEQPSPRILVNTKFNQGSMVGNPTPQPTAETIIESGGVFSFDDEDK